MLVDFHRKGVPVMVDYKSSINKYINLETEIIKNLDVNAINEVMNALEKARLNGGTIYICGNGGSAATASHFASDFNKGVSLNLEKKYNMICLNDNVPTVMAIANDIGYERIFDIQLQNKLKEKDILIAISGSGNCLNVVNAVKYAKENHVTVIGLTGYDGGKVKRLADITLHVPVENMQITEDVHLLFEHMMMWVLVNRQN